MEWLTRMQQALERMEQMMEEPLDMDVLAKAAFSSPFHFQRMFHMLTGMTVAEYMRKRKLTLAAQELVLSSVKVIDIALKYGYESPESFTRAFRKVHGISPSEARNAGAGLKAYPRITFRLTLKGDKDMDYRIVKKEAFRIVGKSVQISTENGENNRRIPEFWKQSNEDGTVSALEAVSPGKDLLGICSMLPGDELLTYIVAVESDSTPPEGYVSMTIPAAAWAVFPSVGPMPGAIQEVWQRIFGEWFPSTGYEHAEAPEIEVYGPGDVTAADYRCEVWIPVIGKQS